MAFIYPKKMNKNLSYLVAFLFFHGEISLEKRHKKLLEDWSNLIGMISFAYNDGGNLFLISAFSDSFL
ncbi:hypothetical protein D8B20_10660 [Candidatus Pantoea soli]|uniref:Uncharacterized protein n=1 Tax=Candidatus Pantoea soli TaxID=3098669 RepID=A0A518XDN5_9GAMM|nr:hypothetical protein D8B20_10660 [Pantoea soli]